MNRIKKIRKELKLSKYELAKRMGVSWNTVLFWEKGIWQPNKKNEVRLQKLYAVNAEKENLK